MADEELNKEILSYINSLLQQREKLLRNGWEETAESIKKALDSFLVHLRVDLSPEIPEKISSLLKKIKLPEEKGESKAVNVLAGIRGMKAETSQNRLITHLFEALSRIVNRSILFVLKEGKIIGWDGRGFEGMSEIDYRRLVMPLNPKSTFGKVINDEEIYIGKFPNGIEDNKVLTELGSREPFQAIILPMIVRGKPVGIVYCDEIPEESPIKYPEEIQILVEYSEAMVELLPVRARYIKEKAERKTSRILLPEEEKIKVTPSPRAPVSEEDTLKGIPTIGEREYEEPTTKPAPEVVPELEIEAEELSEEEKGLHEVAKRKARVLVSDIILYNREKIEEGKSKGNIYNELKDEITLAKEIYKRKVNPKVKEDYLYRELLDKLADGEPSLLEGYSLG